jgi:molybdate-binding protein
MQEWTSSPPARRADYVRLGKRKLYERLDFVPLLFENFDLLMRQRSYFRPSIQALIGFLGEKRLKQRAAELTGYDPTQSGQIRFAAYGLSRR